MVSSKLFQDRTDEYDDRTRRIESTTKIDERCAVCDRTPCTDGPYKDPEPDGLCRRGASPWPYVGECEAHRVDWRDRALEAEQQLVTVCNLREMAMDLLKDRNVVIDEVNRQRDRHLDLRRQAERKAEKLRGWWMKEKDLRSDVFGEILVERGRQDRKWGEQNHPNVDPLLTCLPEHVCREYEIPTEKRAKYLYELFSNNMSWPRIAVEELSEAVSAFAVEDEDAGRAELVQLAAVIVQWIQCIDRLRDRKVSHAE